MKLFRILNVITSYTDGHIRRLLGLFAELVLVTLSLMLHCKEKKYSNTFKFNVNNN